MADKKRKRWNRYAKASQFTRGAGGQLAYTGRFYTFCEDQTGYPQSMRVRSALVGVQLAAVVVCGCMPVAALRNTWYVLLPYMLTVLAVISQVWAVCRMGYWGNPLREYVYDATVRQLPVRTMLTMILSMCTLCGQICYLVLHGLQDEGYLVEIAFLGLQIVVLVGSILLKRAEKGWQWMV